MFVVLVSVDFVDVELEPSSFGDDGDPPELAMGTPMGNGHGSFTLAPLEHGGQKP